MCWWCTMEVGGCSMEVKGGCSGDGKVVGCGYVVEVVDGFC